MIFINYLISAIWMALLFPVACLAMLVTWSASRSMWIARVLWAPLLLGIGGARIRVRGRENIDASRPTIYVCNHQSTLDIPIVVVSLKVDRVRFVAKSSLKWVPILGWYLKLAGHILIDRAKSASAIATLDKAARQIQRGTSIIVFAEGTRSQDGRILPFKKGPFVLALKAGVAVVPVTIEGSGAMMPKNSWAVRKNRDIFVTFGAPIDASSYSLHQREEFIKRVRAVIIEQSLQSGGKGGDPDDAVAAPGAEGIGRPRGSNSSGAPSSGNAAHS